MQSHHNMAAAICLDLGPHLPLQPLLLQVFQKWPLAPSVPHLLRFTLKVILKFGEMSILQHSLWVHSSSLKLFSLLDNKLVSVTLHY